MTSRTPLHEREAVYRAFADVFGGVVRTLLDLGEEGLEQLDANKRIQSVLRQFVKNRVHAFQLCTEHEILYCGSQPLHILWKHPTAQSRGLLAARGDVVVLQYMHGLIPFGPLSLYRCLSESVRPGHVHVARWCLQTIAKGTDRIWLLLNEALECDNVAMLELFTREFNADWHPDPKSLSTTVSQCHSVEALRFMCDRFALRDYDLKHCACVHGSDSCLPLLQFIHQRVPDVLVYLVNNSNRLHPDVFEWICREAPVEVHSAIVRFVMSMQNRLALSTFTTIMIRCDIVMPCDSRETDIFYHAFIGNDLATCRLLWDNGVRPNVAALNFMSRKACHHGKHPRWVPMVQWLHSLDGVVLDIPSLLGERLSMVTAVCPELLVILAQSRDGTP